MITETPPTPSGDRPQPADPAQEIRAAVHDAGATAQSALKDAGQTIHDRGAEKVDAATTTAGDSLQQVAAQLRQAGENLGEEQTWAAQALRQGADGVERVSGYLRTGRMDDFARDLQTFARQNPAAFLAGGVAIGFLAARVAKTAAAHAAPSPATTRQAEPPADTTGFDEGRSFAAADDALGYPQAGEI
ncbi:MAG: hypothetical protein ACK4Z5_09290 [Brevundimonas sp.]